MHGRSPKSPAFVSSYFTVGLNALNPSTPAVLTLPLAIIAICYYKCRVATNRSHWLKVHSRWFKKYISAKKCILIYFSFTLYYCAIFTSLNAGFFITIWVSKSSDPQNVGSDLGPNCLKRLSADVKSCASL